MNSQYTVRMNRKTPIKIVRKFPMKWRPTLICMGHRLYGQLTNSVIQAAISRDSLALEHFGSGCWLNFPNRIRRSNFKRWILGTQGFIKVVFIKQEDGTERELSGIIEAVNCKNGTLTIKLLSEDNRILFRSAILDSILLVEYKGKVRAIYD